MSRSEKIKAYFERIREKHKLIFIDDTNYQEKWSFNVSSLNLWLLLTVYTILIIVLLFVVLRFTPLKNLFSSAPDPVTSSQVQKNAAQLDSLERITASRQKYLDDLQAILNDKPFNDSIYTPKNDSLNENYIPDFTKTKEDSLLRYKMENTTSEPEIIKRDANYEFFYTPVNGVVSKSYNAAKNHWGVDVVAKKDEAVKACLDGTVILTGWQASEGNIVVVQHQRELVSVYKHCSVLMKKQGDKVQAGDPIGVVGSTGENSSGPHLHFELWKNGKPLNPEEYISF